MDIYIDIYFLENFLMDYLMLLMTAKFSKSSTSNLRLLIGSLIGAVYAVLMLVVPGMKIYYTAFGKIAVSFLLVAVTFSPKKLGAFIRTLAIFYASSFIFGGAAFAFLYFYQRGGFIRNGVVVFFNIEWTMLILSAGTVLVIGRIFWDLVQLKFIRERLLIPLRISFGDNTIDISALIDTGNSLRDPLTNLPVVVVEFRAIKDILPDDIKSIFELYGDSDLSKITGIITNSSWCSRFRLVPFTSLGKENGMLIGFKPDYIEIGDEEDKKDVRDVIVGIYNRALSRDEKYKALLSPELI